MLLVNDPVPVPSEVFEFAIVGFADVLQHTPRAVIADPPSKVIEPPHSAEVFEILEIEDVVNVGTCRLLLVVNETSLP